MSPVVPAGISGVRIPAWLLAGLGILTALAMSPCFAEEGSAYAFSLPTALPEEQVVTVDPSQAVTVVCFLGAECPLVRMYSSRLSRMAQEFSDHEVRFIGINSNRQDTDDDIREFLQRHPLAFPLLRDKGNRVADLFGATRTPEVFVLDASLRLKYRGRIDDQYEPGITRNAATRHDLRLAIQEVLAGAAVTVPQTIPTGCVIGRIRRTVAEASETSAAQSGSDVPQHATSVNVTWCREVSRVVQQHCQECHRTGEIGPFPLETYEDAAGWAETMVEVTADGRMPPWHAATDVGHFVNARHMPVEDRRILRDWVAAGLPKGDETDLPEPVDFVSGWQLHKRPNVVIPMRDRAFVVPAEGTVEYQYFVVDPEFAEDQWVSGAQIIPGNRAVVHHAIVFIRPPDGSDLRGVGWLTAYVPGQRLSRLPEGYARRVPAGSRLVFQMHYTPTGAEQQDLTEVGVVLTDRSQVTHEVITLIGLNQEFEIPPQAADFGVEGEVQWKPPSGVILSAAPHMHVRGKSFQLSVERSSGAEMLLHVPRYDFNWQHAYEFAVPIPLADINRLRFTATFDNSPGNPSNPDPSRWIHWGDQTWEEMAVVFLEVAEPMSAATPSSESRLAESGLDSVIANQQREQKIRAFIAEFFDKLDHNRDGVVLRSEVPVAVRTVFERFDVNDDQRVDHDELRRLAERRFPE